MTQFWNFKHSAGLSAIYHHQMEIIDKKAQLFCCGFQFNEFFGQRWAVLEMAFVGSKPRKKAKVGTEDFLPTFLIPQPLLQDVGCFVHVMTKNMSCANAGLIKLIMISAFNAN